MSETLNRYRVYAPSNQSLQHVWSTIIPKIAPDGLAINSEFTTIIDSRTISGVSTSCTGSIDLTNKSTVIGDTFTGDIDLCLPLIASNPTKVICFHNTGSAGNSINISATGSDSISGPTSVSDQGILTLQGIDGVWSTDIVKQTVNDFVMGSSGTGSTDIWGAAQILNVINENVHNSRTLRTVVNQSSYTAAPKDSLIAVTYTEGPVTITLPSGCESGKIITVVDETGNAQNNNITVVASPGSTIIGYPSVLINLNHMALGFYFNGTDKWGLH